MKKFIFGLVVFTLSISANSENIELLCEYELGSVGTMEAMLKMDTTASTAHIGVGRGVDGTLTTTDTYYVAEGQNNEWGMRVKTIVSRKTGSLRLETENLSSGYESRYDGTCKKFEGNKF